MRNVHRVYIVMCQADVALQNATGKQQENSLGFAARNRKVTDKIDAKTQQRMSLR